MGKINQMQIKQTINNFIERTFRDKIVAVHPIEEMHVTYRDVSMRLEGYFVPVTYKYRGRQRHMFMIDNDHYQLVSASTALKNAQDFQLRMSRKMYKQKSGTDDQDFSQTVIDISHPTPIYDAHGHIKEYGVKAKYLISKTFVYVPNADKDIQMKNAVSWVNYIQHCGYKLLVEPKYIDSVDKDGHSCIDVIVLCEYNKQCKKLPLFNAGERAWQFWIKKQEEAMLR